MNLARTRPAPLPRSAGNFVVTFFSYVTPGNDSSYGSVQARRFSSNGVFGGSQFQVNTITPSGQEPNAIDANVNDAFIASAARRPSARSGSPG